MKKVELLFSNIVFVYSLGQFIWFVLTWKRNCCVVLNNVIILSFEMTNVDHDVRMHFTRKGVI